MKEYIISADEVETLEEILHTKFSFPEENELIRCKYCGRNHTLECPMCDGIINSEGDLKTFWWNRDDGFCHFKKRKEE